MNTDDPVDRIHERARADRAEAKCAEMRHVFNGWHATNCSVSDPSEPHCDCGYEQGVQHALSSDCGKDWRSPEEYAALEAKLSEEQKESQRAWGRNNSLESQLAIVLARGKGFIPATVLDKTIEVLEVGPQDEEISWYSQTCKCSLCKWFRTLQNELTRLKAVREEARQ